MSEHECGVLHPEKYGTVTPVADLPRFDPERPRRKIIVTIEVPDNFENRLDMQWCIEREIHADRWSWSWPKPELPLAPIADALTALDRIATRIPVKPFPDPGAHSWEAYAEAVRYAYTDCVNVARRVLREFPIGLYEQYIAAAKDAVTGKGR